MYDPLKHSRYAVRWAGCDYAGDGAYFVTLCAARKVCLFGDAIGEGIRLNGYGRIVQACWEALPEYYVDLRLDAFVVMPNHIHGIIVLGDVGAGPRPAQHNCGEPAKGGSGTRPYTIKRHGLSEIVRGFKSMSARRINEVRRSPGKAVGQRSFHDRVIRDEDEWWHIFEYIEGNPAQWAADRENPSVKITTRDKKSPWL